MMNRSETTGVLVILGTFSLLLVLCFSILACSVKPSKISKNMAEDFVDSITYVMDERTGLCFALVVMRKSGERKQSGIGMASVPCSAIKPAEAAR